MNTPFIYNESQALAAGQSQFITESGAYIVTIKDAQYCRHPSGAKSVELAIETDDGRKAQYLHLYYEKKEGDANPYGVNLIHALMGCTGVRQLTPPIRYPALVAEWIEKKTGLLLQKTLRTTSDGKDTYRLDIIMPFLMLTGQTLLEKREGQPAQYIQNRLASLKDKDERTPKKILSPFHLPQIEEDIPF